MAGNFDLVIRGGTILDGNGGEPYEADLAVQGRRIACIGDIREKGRDEIDARGKIVCPGFIDVHTHYDGQITWERQLSPSSGHGVTTVVMGNCGVGFAPVRPDHHDILIRLMEGVEDIPEAVMAEGVPWAWESFGDYLDFIEQRHADIDFAAQLPHSPLRVYVMGQRGVDLEPPTENDLAVMRRMTSEALKAGAIGVSTSRALAHRFRDGRLAPSVATEEQELMALADGLADAGRGVFQITPAMHIDARDELTLMHRLIHRSRAPLSFSLLANVNRPANWDIYVAALDEAARTGLPLRGQFPARPIGTIFGLDLSYHPFSLNPSFRAIEHLPLTAKVERMGDPSFRERLLAEAPEDPNAFFRSVVMRDKGLFVLRDPLNYNRSHDSSLEAKAARQGRPLRDVIYDTLLEDGGNAMIWAPSAWDIEAQLRRSAPLLNHPNAVVALGDGGAHYGMICDAAYTTYLLTQRLGDGGTDLPHAIQALSARPAQLAGFGDRGLLRAGYKADINIIDMDRLSLRVPQVVRDLPAEGRRLTQASVGYDATLVSGTIIQRGGERTGATPGRLVRGSNRQRGNRQ